LEGYWTIKHNFPGTNYVYLLVRKSDGVPFIWKPEAGQKGRGSVYWGHATYCVDKALGLGVIAETEVIREPERGVMVRFIDGVDIYSTYRTPKERDAILNGREDYRKIILLDWIMGNKDRYDWHLLLADDGLYGIDNTNIFNYAGNSAMPAPVPISRGVDLVRLESEVSPYADIDRRSEMMRRLRMAIGAK